MTAALILAIATTLFAATTPKPAPTEVPSCLEFYKHACSEAIGKWLPEMDDWYGFEFFDLKAKRVNFTDAFIYEGYKPKWRSGLFAGWELVRPRDGTFFVYGSAGPPKGELVYDYAHETAFYDQGCCAWREVVAAAGVPPPPKRVVSRNLTALHTLRGVALGQSIEDVLRLYGKAPVATARHHPAIQRLTYLHNFDKDCGQSQNFIFKNDRLIYIALIDSC
ncbi:MAG TPA: hypothetical protein VFO29_07850 [Candidatus Rubrimentiphilum sp.]|nr:hypothetical protein [Candidatus Rubrimentiphilum sp.]